MLTAEQQARVVIDRLLNAAGWAVQDFKAAHVQAARGVALREFELNAGHRTADYLRYVDGKTAGVVAVKIHSEAVSDVEVARLNTPTLPAPEQQQVVTAVDRRFSIIQEIAVKIAANLKRAQAFRSAVLARASGAA
jgi:hypothetical protein